LPSLPGFDGRYGGDVSGPSQALPSPPREAGSGPAGIVQQATGTFGPYLQSWRAEIIALMFVAQELTISIGSHAAQARLANLIRGNWLTEMSQAAYGEGLTGLLRVGPARPAARLVRVAVVEPVYQADTMSVGVRWEASGAAGGPSPVLDATITISPAPEPATAGGTESSRLALAGTYRPPLGRLGAELDTAILSRVANATICSVLRSTVTALTSPAATTENGNIPILRPAPGTETP
jgi:hypothetical protein